ncbi:hypothetical protein [Cupriavidus agavae]|uniref:Uncharacterized protein n=1 Tax=Cupriavidus agavae TaxID=1001822 RepID=A0A4Q7RVC6_9BURK|nr:hypothetical protein [Cupriavidus agavae]RZT36680.1 hypothetical protein EV147_3342 [Cupriavidus agavae]
MDPLSFEFVSVEEAKKVLDGEPPASAQVDWSALREPPDAARLALSPAALKWLAYLPREVRPLELFHAYPRIANQMAALGNGAAVSALLSELLIDRRGGRQGFPAGVATELTRLQEYLLTLRQAGAAAD